MATQTPDTSKESKKPLKPMTSYCIFFRLEKNYLYQKVNKGGVDPSDLPPPEQRFDPDNPGFECPPLPERYKGVILPKNFYKTIPKGYEWEGKRRQHRKRESGLPLPKLSRTVASNWKTAGTFCIFGMLEFPFLNLPHLQSQLTFFLFPFDFCGHRVTPDENND